MNPPSSCPRCGTALGPDAPEGLCPRCLLQMNLATQTKFTGETSGATPPAPPPLPADIAAKFPQLEIIECLGRGGMGVVYKVRQPLLDRVVALKILAPEREKDPQFAERFTREAQALARLNHPNIVTVFDFGESGGLFYLLMEYVDGVNLRQMIEGKKLASEQALAIVPRICEALQYAHEQGIVHRDIKPENVLLDKQGRVKIADFGIAKLLGVEDGRSAFTKGRQVIGTPFYMAPEQVEHPLDVDHRADIYSLGVVFYEMLTGELPLGRFALPSEKVRIDVRLDEVVLHALEKDPHRRYQQASQVKTDLDTIASSSPKATVAADPKPSSTTQPSGAVHAPAPSPVPPSGPSRLSRLAVFGAVWAALFFALTPAFVLHETKTHEFENYGPFASAPMFFICFGFILPVLLAPFGVTILGWVACAQIRRSAGRLHGLWLAVFDGLLFPLIALDGVIGFFCYMVLIAVCGGSEYVPERDQAIFYLSALSLSAVADGLIVWLIWRAERRAANGALAAASAVPAKNAPDGLWKMVGTMTAYMAVFVILFIGIIVAIAAVNWLLVPRSTWIRTQMAQSTSAAQKNVIQQELQAKQLRQLQDAQNALALARQKAGTGLITSGELQAAKDRVVVAQAQLNGDAVKIAQAQLTAAQNQLNFAEQQYKAGLIDHSAEESAKNEVQRLQAQLDVIEQQGVPTFFDSDDKQRNIQAAKNEIEQLEVKLQIAEAMGSGGDQGVASAPPTAAESPATSASSPSAPVPPPPADQNQPDASSTAPSTSTAAPVAPSTSAVTAVAPAPVPPAPPPAPDPKAAADMMQALADLLRPINGLDALDAAMPQLQKWQALLKGTPGEPIANAVMDDLADLRAAYVLNDPAQAQSTQSYLYTLQNQFPAIAGILRACVDQPATAKVQAANGVMWPLWVQLQVINQQMFLNLRFGRNGADREKAMQPSGPAALAIWNRAAPRFQAWQALYAGTSAEKVVAALMTQFNELGAALQAGQVMRADVLVSSLNQSSLLIQDALQLCAANPKASSAEIGVALMGPLQARLQTGLAPGFLMLGNDPTGVALGRSLLDEAKPALDAWPAQFKGTPAEKIAAAIVQQVAAARDNFQPDGTGSGPAQLTALVNAFGSPDGSIDRLNRRAFNPANPGLFDALLACVSGPTASTVAAPAAWTDLLALRYLIINNTLPKAPDTDLTQPLALANQAASALADWQAMFNGTPAEKAANVTAAMLGDLRTALQQNQNERVGNLANAAVAQLGNFAQTLRATQPWPGSSSAAFAAGMTERLRADFAKVRDPNAGNRRGGSNNPDPADRLKQIFAALEKIRPQFTAWQALLESTPAWTTANTVAKQLDDLRNALLQNQDLQVQALGDSLSDNLGLAQSQLQAKGE